MGGRQSSEEDQGASDKTFDTDSISFDEDGNLRLGGKPRNKERELQRVAEADDPDEKPGKVWYIIDAQWMRSWLAYAHFNKASPAPGPVRNDNLLEYSAENDEWTPKADLIPASRSGEGSFRRVNKEVWDVYKELYGGGPAIYVDHGDPNDSANWLVEPGFENKKVLKKRKKLRKQGQRRSKDRNASVEADDGRLESKDDEDTERRQSESKAAKKPLLSGGSTDKEHGNRTDTTLGAKSHEYVEDRTVSKQQRKEASAFFGTTATAADPEPEEPQLEPVPEETRPASTSQSEAKRSASAASSSAAASTTASEKTLRDAAPRAQDKLSKGEMMLFS